MNPFVSRQVENRPIYIIVYLVAKPWIWSESEGDLVEIETSI